MEHRILALDYDETLATEGRVEREVISALRRTVESGRELVMVTGRELEDLQSVFGRLDLFGRVVAENGALLYRPATRDGRLLGSAPPASFIDALRARGVKPLSVGRVIVATDRPHETEILETIRDQGLALELVYNKGSLMVLPSGMNKAVGLAAALEGMGSSFDAVVGVGDAENDHPFLERCSRSVAVSNALPTVRERVDWVTEGARGQGVIELVERLLRSDLTDLPRRPLAHA